MEVQFSRHASEKMRIRNVKISDVYATLRFPDSAYEDLEQGTSVAVKKVNAKFIVIIYRMQDEVVKVITLYHTTKLDRLLKAKLGRGAWKKIK